MKCSHVFFCFLFFVCLNAFANPENNYLLMVHEQSDVAGYLKEGEGNIPADTNQLLVEALKDQVIEFQVAPLARIDRLLKAQGRVCASNRIKTVARAQHNLFSLPLNLFLGQRLYSLGPANKVPEKLLNDKQQLISLAKLFKLLPDKMLGVGQGRSYGELLDGQISQIDRNSVLMRPGKDPSVLIKMLARRRVDFLIEYPIDMNKEMRKTKQPFELSSVEVFGAPGFLAGRIACTKTDSSRRFIKLVNTALRQLYQSDEFYKAHTRYLDTADLPLFDRYFRQVFLPAKSAN